MIRGSKLRDKNFFPGGVEQGRGEENGGRGRAKRKLRGKYFPRDAQGASLIRRKPDSSSGEIHSSGPPDLIPAKPLEPFGQSQASGFF